ncbi:hypothetical protein CYMTET_56482 [Cymbomonas tetramitiformis]|uniref:Uncharacterized protein n=1 Tax=Cymbomonas tetramitiformis TaxID=36881 RepID=A0AAE0BC15_9CHLO|nr:hypothetical protein CYMTET_56482 [Cymbomonas tetramitiformis]
MNRNNASLTTYTTVELSNRSGIIRANFGVVVMAVLRKYPNKHYRKLDKQDARKKKPAGTFDFDAHIIEVYKGKTRYINGLWFMFAFAAFFIIHWRKFNQFFRRHILGQADAEQVNEVGIYPVGPTFRGDLKRLAYIRDRLGEIAEKGLLIIDANNVRGAMRFRIGPLQLCSLVSRWAYMNNFQNRVVIIFDHGPKQQAFLQDGICVVFSGPVQIADDVIAREVRWFTKGELRDVVVVTRDMHLRARCTEMAEDELDSTGRVDLEALAGGRASPDFRSRVNSVDSECFMWLLESIPANARTKFSILENECKVQGLLADAYKSGKETTLERVRLTTKFSSELGKMAKQHVPTSDLNAMRLSQYSILVTEGAIANWGKSSKELIDEEERMYMGLDARR